MHHTNNTAISLNKEQVQIILQWVDLICSEDWDNCTNKNDHDLLFYLQLAVDDENE